MVTLLLASAFAVNFPGGSPNEFAATLASETHQNVVLCQGDAENVPKLSIQNADLTEMARAIRSQTQRMILPGSDLILSDGLLPMSQVTGAGFQRDVSKKRVPGEPIVNFEGIQLRHGKYGTEPVSFTGIPYDAIKNGQVTLKTEKTNAVSLQTLLEHFSKPIHYHWLYAEHPIYVQLKDLPELDFMKWIAKGIGARLLFTGGQYDFTLDPAIVRNRAVATLTKLSKEADGNDRKAYEFRIACLNTLTTNQVAEAVATPFSTVRVQIHPGSPLANQAVARIRDLEKLQKTYGPNTRASKAAIGLLDKVDPNRPAYLIMDAKFYTRLEVPVVDAQGNPAGVVNL